MSDEIEIDNLPTRLMDTYYLFVEAFNNTLNSYSEQQKIKVKEFIAEFARTRKPYSIFTIEGTVSINDHIFTVELHRDFVWRLIVNFYSSIGYDPEFIGKLNQTLAFSLDITNTGSDDGRVLTPEEFTGRTLPYQDILDHLNANKWLVVLTLISINYRRSFDGLDLTIQKLVEKP